MNFLPRLQYFSDNCILIYRAEFKVITTLEKAKNQMPVLELDKEEKVIQGRHEDILPKDRITGLYTKNLSVFLFSNRVSGFM